MVDKKVSLIFLVIFLLPLICLSTVDVKWQKRSITINPTSPVAGDAVVFASTFIVRNEPVKNLSFVATLDGTIIMSKNFPSLVKDVPQNVVVNWTAVAGNHAIKFSLKAPRKYREQNTKNNVLQKRFAVPHKIQSPAGRDPRQTQPYTPPKKPDLVVFKLHENSVDVQPHQSRIKIWLRVQNIGEANSKKGKYRMIIDGLESSYYPEVKNYWVESTHILFALTPGEKSLYGSGTTLRSGRYRCIVILDIDDDSKESDETNNRKILEFIIVRTPDY